MKPPRPPECAVPDTFPAELKNRPGLERIAYRIGRYADARRWLLHRLDEDPTLEAWTYRGADDPGIALYESAAILIELLTLYQEVYANEAYLRTATWRESVADLVRLLGYRLQPGIGGTGAFAFEVKGDKPVTIPADFPLKIDLADVSEPGNFQTSDAAIALPWLSRFTLVRPQQPGFIATGANTLVVASTTGQTFAKNDRLLVGVLSDGSAADPRSLDPWEIAIVDSVTEWHGRTVVHLQGTLRKITGQRLSLVAFKLGRTFRHFGHNAPAQRLEVTSTGSTIGHTIAYDRVFGPNITFTGGDDAAGFPALTNSELPLDPETSDVPLGSLLAVQLTYEWPWWYWRGGGTFSKLELARVTDTTTVTCSYGALSAPATIATIRGLTAPSDTILHWRLYMEADIRRIQIDAVEGEPFLVGAVWHDVPADRGATLAWWGDAAQARDLLHRPIAIVPKDQPGYDAVVVDVQATADPGISTITLDRDVPYADFSDDAGTLVFGNLVDATEGKAEVLEVLGNGDEHATFQTFQVPKDPLTYLHRAEQSPPERPEIEIIVGDRIWKYVPSLYAYGPTDEVYVVRQDNDGASWVQFGDGKTGARLPSGVDNVKIRWRTGSGSFGPAKPDAHATPGIRIDAIDEVTLPGVIAGGSAPETADVARVAAPLRVQSLDRLVSLSDIEAETLGIGGVERARAAWAIVDGLPMVQVTVLMQPKRLAELGDVRAILAASDRTRGPQRYPIVVVAGGFEYVYLDLEVAIDPAAEPTSMRAAVQAVLDGPKGLLGGGPQRSFGGAEYATRIEGVVQNVPGVMWAVVRAFGSLGVADDPALLQFPSAPSRVETVACPSTHVLRLGPSVIRLSPGGTP